jgi:hypothetical protein
MVGFVTPADVSRSFKVGSGVVGWEEGPVIAPELIAV